MILNLFLSLCDDGVGCGNIIHARGKRNLIEAREMVILAEGTTLPGTMVIVKAVYLRNANSWTSEGWVEAGQVERTGRKMVNVDELAKSSTGEQYGQ